MRLTLSALVVAAGLGLAAGAQAAPVPAQLPGAASSTEVVPVQMHRMERRMMRRHMRHRMERRMMRRHVRHRMMRRMMHRM